MKFAVAALLAVASADGQIPVASNIKFNKEGLDNSIEYAAKAGKELSAEQKANNKKNVEGVVDAYSHYRVEEYVQTQKTWSPLVKF